MSNPYIKVHREGSIVYLTMDEPATRNALSSAEQCAEFVDVLTEINCDDGIRSAILTGAGPAFCAGGNIKDMETKSGIMAGTLSEIAERYRRTLQRLAQTLYGLEVPIIAAVNGPAMGAGLDLACMCDIRIASHEAKFAETFVRLGLISGIGGSWFLPRAVGIARASELAFTGRVIDAETARAIGLVSEVVEKDKLIERASALAAEISQNSGTALRYTKRLLRLSERSELSTSLEATAALQTLAHSTNEHKESVDLYLEEQRLRRASR